MQRQRVTAESSYQTESMVFMLDRGTPKKLRLVGTFDARIQYRWLVYHLNEVHYRPTMPSDRVVFNN
jgi:hypothetical protein